jgi:hypothetical protein
MGELLLQLVRFVLRLSSWRSLEVPRRCGRYSQVRMTTIRSRQIERPFGSNRGIDAPGRNRTYDLALRRRALYPLSYRR